MRLKTEKHQVPSGLGRKEGFLLRAAEKEVPLTALCQGNAWLDPATPKDHLKDILSHDIDGQLQFNRVGRDVNSTLINKQPNDHPALVGPINPL
ncbi:hypothetical protein AB4Z43_28645 [Mesorhizobium sp. 2RAF45]|uniref:hypothetical protein n=1 Tax=Mesorhizobium sp. 2RAF45 TaxID=3233001 RepID=UPI003F9AA25D